jgi:Hemolysin coregulated protein Hcp (TssD)
MSFKAEFVVGGTKFNVLSFNMTINQMTDQHGVPRDRVRCDSISLVLESSGKDDDISEWATSPKMKKDGEISFFKRDASAVGKTIAFEQAFCVQYSTNFTNDDENPMTIQITLSALLITINSKFKVTSPVFNAKGSKKGGNTTNSSSSAAQKPVSSFIAD